MYIVFACLLAICYKFVEQYYEKANRWKFWNKEGILLTQSKHSTSSSVTWKKKTMTLIPIKIGSFFTELPFKLSTMTMNNVRITSGGTNQSASLCVSDTCYHDIDHVVGMFLSTVWVYHNGPSLLGTHLPFHFQKTFVPWYNCKWNTFWEALMHGSHLKKEVLIKFQELIFSIYKCKWFKSKEYY